MSGFLLENVHVETIPRIESDYEYERESNPLIQLVHSQKNARKSNTSQNIKNVYNHIVKLEKKVKNLEQRFPSNEVKQRIWLGSVLSNQGSITSDESKRKNKKNMTREKKEDRSCFARLLFSRCWTGKDHAGWKVKRKCPTRTGSLSCPCGMIGPCRKIKKNPIPLDKLKSNKGKNAEKQNDRKKGSKPDSSGGKPLLEKLLPCCFQHVHGECCCRCKDNPPLHCPSKKVTNKVPNSESATSDVDIDANTVTIQSVSDLSLHNHDRLSYLQKQATGDGGPSHTSTKRHKFNNESYMASSNTANIFPINTTKSTTSFKIMLHPEVSKDKIVEPEVVSHQILKTLSTIHGPVKVEQKIVLQGTKNSVVVVTHGETCQCNLCHMLKGKMHPTELVDGLSPQIVKISTDSGCNTLINHIDGCKCELCLVLDPVVTKDSEPGTTKEDVKVGRDSSDDDPGDKLTPKDTLRALHSITNPTQTSAEPEDTSELTKSPSLIKRSKSAKNGKANAQKCKCAQCRHRRRVEKMKQKLKKEIGSMEYERVIGEITPNDSEDTPKGRGPSHSFLVGQEIPKRNKKFVSFSDEAEQDASSQSTVGECKLCKLLKGNVKNIFENKKDHNRHHDSTIYSVNTSSHDMTIQDFSEHSAMSEDSLKSHSETSEKISLVSEEQRCFPTRRRKRKRKIMNGILNDNFTLINEAELQISLKHGSNCSGRCRQEESTYISPEHPQLLFSDGSFPRKFVYWSPGSRSNVVTACSSDSYYVPDQEEFPIVNVACEESSQSSEQRVPSLHRVQFPVWFRMMPDRNGR